MKIFAPKITGLYSSPGLSLKPTKPIG